MGDKDSKKYVEPIVNASHPAKLAGLSLTVLKFSADDPIILKLILLLGAIMFIISSFLIFFYSLYPTRRLFWTGTGVAFLLGLLCTGLSSVILLVLV